MLITKSRVSKNGQIIIPAEIRRRHNIKDGDQLVWIDDGKVIKVIPVPSDAIAVLYGSGKGQGLTQKLLEERAKDRDKENGV